MLIIAEIVQILMLLKAQLAGAIITNFVWC